MQEALISGLIIFLLRLGDVPIGTVRTMLMVQGRKLPVMLLAVCESAIWVLAISTALSGKGLDHPLKIVGYACGFATGTILGMTIEGWLAIGKMLVRVISSESGELRRRLLDAGFGVTAIQGEGRDGPVAILFIVTKRKRSRELLRLIQEIDPDSFITTEPVSQAIGGFVHQTTEAPTAMKK